jgi:hypothetical protein
MEARLIRLLQEVSEHACPPEFGGVVGYALWESSEQWYVPLIGSEVRVQCFEQERVRGFKSVAVQRREGFGDL